MSIFSQTNNEEEELPSEYSSSEEEYSEECDMSPLDTMMSIAIDQMECGPHRIITVNCGDLVTAMSGNFIDMSELNRMLNHKRIEEISSSFNPEMCDTIHLAWFPTEERLKVIDGQHRLMSLERIDYDKVEEWVISFRIITCHNDEDYASHFDCVNDRLSISSSQLDKYKMMEMKDMYEKRFILNYGGKIRKPFAMDGQKQSSRPQLPYSSFVTALRKTKFYSEAKDASMIFARILRINAFLKKQRPLLRSRFTKEEVNMLVTNPKGKDRKSYIYKSQNNKYFLGLHKDILWMPLLDCIDDSEWDTAWREILGARYLNSLKKNM